MRTITSLLMAVALTHCGTASDSAVSESRRGGTSQAGDAKRASADSEAMEECNGLLIYLTQDHDGCKPQPAPVETTVKKTASTTDVKTPAVKTTPKPSDPANGDPNVVVFRIAAGTGAGAWNTKDGIVTVKMGQTIRIVNEDTVAHRLHTGGAPCPHGTQFNSGATYDCVVTKAFDATVNGPVYDHNYGGKAAFWVKVAP